MSRLAAQKSSIVTAHRRLPGATGIGKAARTRVSFRGTGHSFHGPGRRSRQIKENISLTCEYVEPPIGIEPMTYALRGCSRALLVGSKRALASCSQVAAGGDRWLLMAVRGHLGGTLVMRRPGAPAPAERRRPHDRALSGVAYAELSPMARVRLSRCQLRRLGHDHGGQGPHLDVLPLGCPWPARSPACWPIGPAESVAAGQNPLDVQTVRPGPVPSGQSVRWRWG